MTTTQPPLSEQIHTALRADILAGRLAPGAALPSERQLSEQLGANRHAVREALNAEQIYWAEREDGKRMFRQYVNAGEVHPCVIVDDISRTGRALQEAAELVGQLGARIIGCGVIVRFKSAPDQLEIPGDDPIPVLSLVEFDAKWYDDGDACAECNKEAPVEHVRF